MRAARKAVIGVSDARGFIVGNDRYRYVLTAAHCLPKMPPAHPLSYTEERTYANLLGHLGETKREVWAECLYADPVADLAVLGRPDDQSLHDESDAHEKFIEAASWLRIADAPKEGPGWLLSLDGRWFGCTVQSFGKALSILRPAEPIMAGMSGSPVLSADGVAVGIVSVSSNSEDSFGEPCLTANLPGWLLRELLPGKGIDR